MKLAMPKQKLKKRNIYVFNQLSSFALVLVFVFVMAFGGTNIVSASIQDKINKLSAENSGISSEKDTLEDEALSLKDKIAKLEAKISTIQKYIDDNQAKINKLKDKIHAAEAELERQKELLGQNIRAMYLEGDISTLEMLASSRDLSEFVDKQQYRSAVQNKIEVTLDKIYELKNELKKQHDILQSRLDDQERSRSELAKQRSVQSNLLGLNQSEQDALNAEYRKNSKRIEELRRQQVIENMRLFGGSGGTLGGGGYPWGRAKCLHTGRVDGWCPNYDWAVNGSVNNWQTGGYGYRNCTDWVSFRVRVSGRFVPSGLGNANTWDDRAPSFGYKVSGTPKTGSAAVSNSGFYGHVMYVEAVNGDGTIVVSDYNRAGTGRYDTNTISASGLRFIYF